MTTRHRAPAHAAAPDYGREIFVALGQIRSAWDDMLTPQHDTQVARITASDPARPPVPVTVLSLRRDVDETLTEWVTIVAAARNLTSRPATGDVPGACGFLMTHADWLGSSEHGPRASNELYVAGRDCVDVVRGNRTRRYQVGRCPEVIIDDDGVEVEPCRGNLWALIREEDTMMPKHVQCDAVAEHQWDPHQWRALGRRVSPLRPAAVMRLVKRIAG